MTTAEASTALAEIQRSPQFPSHVRELQEMLELEARRRERFYEEIDERAKAEFINGQVILHSPARLEHLEVSTRLTTLLYAHVARRRLGKVFVEKCLVRCERNDYEPDICFFGVEKAGRLEPRQRLFPPPDLAVEILSPSTEGNDREMKLGDYAAHGVGEYWIVDADSRAIEQYRLAPGANVYHLHARVDPRGQLASSAVEGFAVPGAAVFDPAANVTALEQLLRGPA